MYIYYYLGGGMRTIDCRLEPLLLPTVNIDSTAHILSTYEQQAAVEINLYMDKILEEVDVCVINYFAYTSLYIYVTLFTFIYIYIYLQYIFYTYIIWIKYLKMMIIYIYIYKI